jgi:3-dehydroquinate synthetase
MVERDERESGLCAIMNAGHSFGLAIETAMGCSTCLHGEACIIADFERHKRIQILPG